MKSEKNSIHQLEMMWLTNQLTHFDEQKADINQFPEDTKNPTQILIHNLLKPNRITLMCCD